MKVLAINGSPKAEGNTFHALRAVCEELENQGIQTGVLQVGHLPITGCVACGACRGAGRCVLGGEAFDQIAEEAYAADGLLLGTPVYFAGVNGTMKSFLDRLFYAARGRMRHKVGAAVAVARRSGNMTAFEEINAYFLISEMLIAPSYYWNAVHGGAPGEVLQDLEAMSVLRNLGRNMAWMLRMKEATAEILPPPEPAPRQSMNFIR